MNKAIAAPAAAPDSSKSPVIGLLKNSRPMMLAHVIRVMNVSSTPAKMAIKRANCCMKCMPVSDLFAY